jgi:hypothetical protein
LQGSAARVGAPPITNMTVARKATNWANLGIGCKFHRNGARNKAVSGPTNSAHDLQGLRHGPGRCGRLKRRLDRRRRERAARRDRWLWPAAGSRRQHSVDGVSAAVTPPLG